MKPAVPVKCWAVIVRSKRTEWIHWMTIARTKKEAWERYVYQWTSRDYANQQLQQKKVRLAKVIVSLHEHPSPPDLP